MPKSLPDHNEFDIKILKPFSEIELVALDLDGTLLESSDSELPRKVYEFANKFKNYKTGVRLTIATGRTLAGARPLLEKLPINKNTPIILYNGSLIINKNLNVLFQKKISNKALKKIIKISSKFNVKLIAYVFNSFGLYEPEEQALGWSSLDHPKYEHNKMPVAWFGWNEVDDSASPSAIVIHTFGNDQVRTGLSRELEKINGISYTFGQTYIEVSPKGSNKGTALKFVAKELELSKKQILAMGDNDNDAPMLSWAGIGVAVDKASELAIEKSNYTAKWGEVQGAIELLGIVHNARRLFKNK